MKSITTSHMALHRNHNHNSVKLHTTQHNPTIQNDNSPHHHTSHATTPHMNHTNNTPLDRTRSLRPHSTVKHTTPALNLFNTLHDTTAYDTVLLDHNTPHFFTYHARSHPGYHIIPMTQHYTRHNTRINITTHNSTPRHTKLYHQHHDTTRDNTTESPQNHHTTRTSTIPPHKR